MYLKEVVIDGFKSYAVRTVISGWDSTFNAITGLNGSGKSNVLDAICFVLGITNLSQVRASSLTDLVYKSGQSGVTKASVSLVFDNSETKSSPIGYDHCETITVTRTIIIGGRNKYLINGHAVQASAVQNLFHSVGLNVNNPHFLIMQGRITKVLNMKPPEILGMVEEAAGTRMFEAKKQAAIKTIEKKQSKVDEIDKILSEDINPTLEKLRGERRAYLEWAKNNTECERLARFCVAYEFVTAMATAKDAAGKQAECASFLKTVQTKIQEMKATISAKEAELKARESERSAAMSGAFKRLIDQEDSLGKSFAQVSAALENQKKGFRDEERAYGVLQKSSAESDAQLAALHSSLQKQTATATAAHQTASASAAEVQSLMSKYNAASAGLAVDDDGMGRTLVDQHLASKTRATTLSSEISSTELRIKHLSGTQKDLSKSAKSAAADHTALQGALQKATAGLEAKRAKQAALPFNAAQDEALRSKRDIIAAEVTTLSDKLEPQIAMLSSLMEFSYDAASLGPGFSAASVKGVVARLFSLKDARVATALEIAASGKLYQVVVDNELVGKQLLEKGRLRKRVTIIPLNKVKRNGISKDKVELAASISKGTAVPAIQLVDFDESVRAAMEYTFGGFFVCPDAETAKAITFHPKIGITCVTFDGDMFDPAGTLEGGSKPELGGEPLLLRLAAVSASQQRLSGLRAELRNLEEKISSVAKVASDFAALASDIELAQHEVSLLQQRVGASQLSATESKLADTMTSIQKEEAQLLELRQSLKETQQRIKDLEAELANVVKAREAQMATLGKQLDAAKKTASSAEASAKKAQHEVDKLTCDFESAKAEKETSLAALKEADAALATTRADMEKATGRCTSLEAQYQKAKAELDAARETIAANDKAMKAILKERDTAKSAIEEYDAEIKRNEAKQKTLAKDALLAEKMVKDLRAGHAWIEGDEEYFGKPHTDYDFAATDPKAASAKLTSLEKKQNELERKINKKVIGMIEQAEREYADLVNKKRIIENDKSKIEKVICELDEKKNEALKSTWTKVNKDFGSIFSTLLPGVTAKLDPPEGGTVLDGLEVKVAFNGVWKESLTELSGGQRSLLALSLILSMLLFKPAPMYILDEVDAALDLSHTQNIGHMIKTYFGQSQFIVVSLKQGMFNNANVIFRTKFIEGIGSTVARTLPTPTGASTDTHSKTAPKKMSAMAPVEEATDAENSVVTAPAGKRAVAGAGMEASSTKTR